MPATLPAPPFRAESMVVRTVAPSRPLAWLAAGARDLLRDPFSSLAWGLLFAMTGDVILLLALPHAHLFSLAVSSFFLVAPLLAAGLYEISRRHARNEPVSYWLSLSGWRRNGQSLALFGLFLALAAILWERLSAVVFSLTVDGVPAVDGRFVASLFLSADHLAFLVPWLGLGGVLAALVFALGVITSPLLIDRPVDVVTAMFTSVRVTLANPLAMLVWASLIVILTVLGFATLLFGLIVLMPILGHASSHAYRELVE